MAKEPTDRIQIERLRRARGVSPLELLVGSERYTQELVANSVLWAGVVVCFGSVSYLVAAQALKLSVGPFVAVALSAVAIIGVMAVFGRQGTRTLYPALTVVGAILGNVVIWLAGPRFGQSAVLVPTFVASCFLFFTRRTAICSAIITCAGYGAVLLFGRGYPEPGPRFLFVTATTAATALLVSRFIGNIQRLAVRERTLHAAVEAANQELEARVTEQVEEIDRLGQLRRFLSPQVADAVLSAGGEDLLATHRRQIAVIFIDLRGFTGFSAVAEPEDVVEVLTEFYEAVGVIVKRLGATVGGFAGDGVMAYFNDPFPCEDPAGHALEMATALREPMARLGERWRQRGFVIGYGAGIAYGYATLGTIGFEERTDYTPIGSVVNLAARLCDEAPPGEVLLDGRAHEAVRDKVNTEPLALELKGFNGPVTAFRLTL